MSARALRPAARKSASSIVAMTTGRECVSSIVPSINLMKIVAILLVMLRHITWHFAVPRTKAVGYLLPPLGELGVNIFLFCSGFGLTVSALTRRVEWREYWKRRFSRVYPLYVTSLLLYVFFVANIDLKNLTCHLLLIHNFVLAYSHNPEPLWYIGVLFQFYAVFPAMLSLLKRNVLFFWAATFLLYSLNSMILSFINRRLSLADIMESNVEDSSVFSFVIVLAAGMYFGSLVQQGNMDAVRGVKRYAYVFLPAVVVLSVYVCLKESSRYQDIYSFGKKVFPVASVALIVMVLDVFGRIGLDRMRAPLGYLSSGVLCAYLFHEFAFALTSLLPVHYLLGIPFGLLLSCFGGVYLQRAYDYGVKRIESSGGGGSVRKAADV